VQARVLTGSVRTGRSLLGPRNDQPISDDATLSLPLSPLQRSGSDSRFESSLPSFRGRFMDAVRTSDGRRVRCVVST
jgi:hypothetical protein